MEVARIRASDIAKTLREREDNDREEIPQDPTTEGGSQVTVVVIVVVLVVVLMSIVIFTAISAGINSCLSRTAGNGPAGVVYPPTHTHNGSDKNSGGRMLLRASKTRPGLLWRVVEVLEQRRGTMRIQRYIAQLPQERLQRP